MTTEHSGTGDWAHTLRLLWGAKPPARRGPKPGLTLDQIVRAAIEIADSEGLGALSMRSIATALGAGTMSLYRYVPGKAELLDLMLDRVLGELSLPSEVEGTWREKLEYAAWEQWRLAHRHPWMLSVGISRQVTGPNALRSYDSTLQVVSETGLDETQMVTTVEMLDSYVRGAARKSVDAQDVERRTGMTQDEWWLKLAAPALESDEQVDFMSYPSVIRVSQCEVFGWPQERTFELGLHHLLDGLEATLSK